MRIQKIISRISYSPVLTFESKTFPCFLSTGIHFSRVLWPISMRTSPSLGFSLYSLIKFPISKSFSGSTSCLALSAISLPCNKYNLVELNYNYSIRYLIRLFLVFELHRIVTFTSSIWLSAPPSSLAAPTTSLLIDPWLISLPINKSFDPDM